MRRLPWVICRYSALSELWPGLPLVLRYRNQGCLPIIAQVLDPDPERRATTIWLQRPASGIVFRRLSQPPVLRSPISANPFRMKSESPGGHREDYHDG